MLVYYFITKELKSDCACIREINCQKSSCLRNWSGIFLAANLKITARW